MVHRREFLRGVAIAIAFPADLLKAVASEAPVEFGAKTLAAGPNALHRINFRRALLRMQEDVTAVMDSCKFEPNDSVLWTHIQEVLRERMSEAFEGYETDFRCDHVTNSSQTMAGDKMVARLLVKIPGQTELASMVFTMGMDDSEIDQSILDPASS